jgi:hypothetical protein
MQSAGNKFFTPPPRAVTAEKQKRNYPFVMLREQLYPWKKEDLPSFPVMFVQAVEICSKPFPLKL